MHANFPALGNDFQRLLVDFPLLTTPVFSATVAEHSVEHFIPMTGLPFFVRASSRCHYVGYGKRRVCHHGEFGCSKAFKQPMGLASSYGAKVNRSWWPSGLNDINMHDRYPITHIQDFSVCLSGMSIFFRGESDAWLPPGSRVRRGRA